MAYIHLAEDCGFVFSPHPGLSSWLERVKSEVGSNYPVHPYTPDATFG